MNPSASFSRPWCRGCQSDATDSCVDEHPESLCTPKRARDAQRLLEALRRGEAAVASLRQTASTAEREALDWRVKLQHDEEGLAAARLGLEGADAAGWEQAMQAAEQAASSLPQSVHAELETHLADPATWCTLTVQHGAAGEALRAQVQTAEDAVARLLLCRLASFGALTNSEERKPHQQSEEPDLAARWEERSNDCPLTDDKVREMAAALRRGSRVARGRDWHYNDKYDDGPTPGPGTVTKVFEDGFVNVVWQHWGMERGHWMVGGPKKGYELRLLEPQLVRTLVGLNCIGDPLWCQAVLEVSTHLEGLQMVSPLPHHVDMALRMPHLQSLCLTLGHSLDYIGVTGEQLLKLSRKASLLSLELHCPLEAPLPVLTFPATQRLRQLRCGVHPLVTALALARAHAASLEELQLVAASTEPYGCPDLAREIRQCGLRKLKRLVLVRQTAYGDSCRHDGASCKLQRNHLNQMFLDTDVRVSVKCTLC